MTLKSDRTDQGHGPEMFADLTKCIHAKLNDESFVNLGNPGQFSANFGGGPDNKCEVYIWAIAPENTRIATACACKGYEEPYSWPVWSP